MARKCPINSAWKDIGNVIGRSAVSPKRLTSLIRYTVMLRMFAVKSEGKVAAPLCRARLRERKNNT